MLKTPWRHFFPLRGFVTNWPSNQTGNGHWLNVKRSWTVIVKSRDIYQNLIEWIQSNSTRGLRSIMLIFTLVSIMVLGIDSSYIHSWTADYNCIHIDNGGTITWMNKVIGQLSGALKAPDTDTPWLTCEVLQVTECIANNEEIFKFLLKGSFGLLVSIQRFSFS